MSLKIRNYFFLHLGTKTLSCSFFSNGVKETPWDCKLRIMESAFNLPPPGIKLLLRNYLFWPSKWIGLDVLNCFLNCYAPSSHSCFVSEPSLMGSVRNTRGWSHVAIKEMRLRERGKCYSVYYLDVAYTRWIEIFPPLGVIPNNRPKFCPGIENMEFLPFSITHRRRKIEALDWDAGDLS